jgi:RES domain-containing protein
LVVASRSFPFYPVSTTASSLSAPIHIAPAAVSFAEYQAIHQQQQRRRYPAQEHEPKPVTSDPWKVKVQRWAVLAATGVAAGYWLVPGGWFSWLLTATVFTALGLAYQWWEYRQAYRQLPDRQQATSFAADTLGITVTQNGSSRFFRWTDFYDIQHVPGWLLLYTSVEHCYYLNLSLVQPPATVADMERLLPTPHVAPTADLV